MEPFFISFIAIAVAEMGDKTQLIAFLLASRFRKPVPVILGILCATLVGHSIDSVIGKWAGTALSGPWLHGALGAIFLAAALWALIPERLEEDPARKLHAHGIFITTFLTFLLAEIGDKTQLATMALAAQFQSIFWVVLGSTAGMMAVNTPAVLASHAIAHRIPIRLIRMASAAIFAGLGVFELSRIGL